MNGSAVFEQVMGAQFGRLPLAVQRFHRLRGRHVLQGQVRTGAPASASARWLGRLLGTPLHADDGPIRFELEAAPEQETWTRHFPGRTMRSILQPAGEMLMERLGPARLGFRLEALDGMLAMQLTHMHFLGLPCPRWLLPRVIAQEHGDGDTLHFRICVALPWMGLVAQYQGHLRLEDAP
ncbi:DUF4166 domain-containing protein [Pseudorhodoferax sp.]|uniref:DUF4166 domain-containing protein n=1 Tax=Pseudorhodoferax sp. TaxID=1993553 RepID=UPI002DD62C3C|nr:DUF4166 domain-containing protein [Pseudorhodoferax sp.]